MVPSLAPVSEMVVLFVRSYPDPCNGIAFEQADSAVVITHPRRIEGRVSWANAFETQAAVTRVLFEDLVGVACLPLNIGGQGREERAEPLCTPRPH